MAGALRYKDFPYLRKFAAEFGKYCRVFSHDRRGRGGSANTKPYGVDKEVEDLAAICREAGETPIPGSKVPAGTWNAEPGLRHACTAGGHIL